MILHLVTDRRRLTPALDDEARVRCLLEQAGFAASAGIDVIQVREHDLDGRALASLTSALVNLTRGSRTRVVVNDRLDIALAARADGVHLRSTSFDAVHVRACSRPGFLIGRSVRTPVQAADAGPVDYLVAGTAYATASKPDAQVLLGASGLEEIVRATAVPVLAIGGIELDRADELARAGVAGVAAIGAWMSKEATCRAIPLNDLVAAFRTAFEAVNMGADIPPVR
jgi:thiamine-phosphate pyrophosphorylase